MLMAFLAWIAKSNGAKTAGAAASGSIVSMAVLMGLLDKSVDQKIDSVNREIIRYVDSRHDKVSTDIGYIKESQREMKDLLQTINDRVYQLNQRRGE